MNRFYISVTAAVLCFTGSLGLSFDAHAQLGVPGVNDTLQRLPTRPVEDRLNRELERKKKAAEELANQAEEQVDETTGEVTDLVDGVMRSMVFDTDPNGDRIEANTIVVMVDSETLDRITASGFDVLSQRELHSLGLTLATLRSTGGTLSATVDELRSTYSDSVVDFNHVYGLTAGPESESAANELSDSGASPAEDLDQTLRIGIIDSAVQSDHRALRNVTVISKDLAINDGLRPLTHGTAVASLVAKSAKDNVTIYAASVFFQTGNNAPGATTEGLVAALDWLASEKVDVINMSLAGPGNAILEAAVRRLHESGPAIVAAVGNIGPSGPPQYPAAYDSTIGITAVDRDQRIFRYANRGEYVDYAALGVDVKVADSSTGGWRIESGTSMAAPHVSVVVARILRSGGVSRDALDSWLMVSAEDLGRNGFDKVFGHGLISLPPRIVSGT